MLYINMVKIMTGSVLYEYKCYIGSAVSRGNKIYMLSVAI